MPTEWVFIDISQMFFVVLSVSDDVIVERFLPNASPSLFCNNAFQLFYNPRHCRGDQWSPVFVGANSYQKVNMIRHDHIAFK